MREISTDILVVGEGVAGLMSALSASQAGARVLVVGLGGGASSWLQGVNVALGHADPRDNPAAHGKDVLREGRGVNDPKIVLDTVESAPGIFRDLVALGVDFARDGDRFRQRHASGSQYPRCCFVPGMMWGPRAKQVLRETLKERPGVGFERLRVVRLLGDGRRCSGAVAVEPPSGRPVLVQAKSVVLASGGIGGLYAHSTYPPDVFGASYALAFRAGARIVDMEFVQFEPLVAWRPENLRGYVIPTTLFGDGAFLRDRTGVRFLPEFRPQGEVGIGKEELVIAMAEIRRRGRAEVDGSVWLDARDVSGVVLASYPWLQGFLLRRGIDLSREMMAVQPAAHTSLGGIAVDVARSTTVPGLFAAGEAAAGIHGAGRLAGGSGTDVIVSGARAGAAAATVKDALPWSILRTAFAQDFVDELSTTLEPTPDQKRIRDRARSVLSTAAGIWRDGPTLSAALSEIAALFAQIELTRPTAPADLRFLLADALMVSGMVLVGAIHREESRGAHQRTDYPVTDPALAQSTAIPWLIGRPFVER